LLQPDERKKSFPQQQHAFQKLTCLGIESQTFSSKVVTWIPPQVQHSAQCVAAAPTPSDLAIAHGLNYSDLPQFSLLLSDHNETQGNPAMSNSDQTLRRATSWKDSSEVKKKAYETLQVVRKRMGKRRYRHESFPLKLFRLLEDCKRAGQTDIVSFTASGRAFRVHDTKRFEREVAPLYFRHNQYHSFQRQLCMYGFERIHSGPDLGGYRHPLFQRDYPLLCAEIHREPCQRATGVSKHEEAILASHHLK